MSKLSAYYTYAHLPVRTAFFMRTHTASEPVSPRDLAVVRHFLDTSGLMERKEFEHLIHTGSLAG